MLLCTDRAHGNEFSTQFEESCLRLEEAVRGLEKTNGEQKDLMAQLHTSEYFYDQQYREARIVANVSTHLLLSCFLRHYPIMLLLLH